MTALLVALLTLLVTAQLVRDRNAAFMLLMCVPLWAPSLLALGWDALLRGRALRRRGLLTAIALALAAWSLAMMWRPARAPEGTPQQRTLRLVQWNTQWGGRDAPLIETLEAQQADLVCLSEAPRRVDFERAWRRARWHTVSVENRPNRAYWYRLLVASRYPVRLRREWHLPTGHAALFELSVPRRPLRVLMVDLESPALRPRTPSIERVAQDLARVDLVLGDFNAGARFRGFDALERAGYRRAALWSGAWSGTWPSFLPLLDIDHVWVRRGLDVLDARFFTSPGIDHRGQRTTLRLPQ